MNTKTRITLEDTAMSAMMKMCDGNPGAFTVCFELLKHGREIDPDGFAGGLGAMLGMDTLGIYGSRIWMLFKDVCGENLNTMCAVLRAWQLGFLTKTDLNHAIDNYGEGTDIPVLLLQVKKRLPSFQINLQTEIPDVS